MRDRPACGTSLRPRLEALLALLWVAGLAGCGAEVAGSAATVGALQAEQGRQALEQQAKVLGAMQQAQEAEARRIADAASAAE